MPRRITLAVLAGGYNTRLRREDTGVPKSLLAVDENGPLLFRLLASARHLGVSVLVVADREASKAIGGQLVATGNEAEFVIDDFGGTAAAIVMTMAAAATPWVLFANADTLVPCDIIQWALKAEPRTRIHLLLAPDSNQNSGLVGVSADTGLVTFHGERTQRRPPSGLQTASTTGVALIHKDVLGSMGTLGPEVAFDGDLVPELVHRGVVSADVLGTLLPVFDFGTTARLDKIRSDNLLRSSLLDAAGLDHWSKTDIEGKPWG